MKKENDLDKELRRAFRLAYVWAAVSIAIKVTIFCGFIYSLYLAQVALKVYIEGGIQ